MTLTRAQKKAQVQDFAEKMKRATSVMFAHYIGVSVAAVSELRATLRDKDAEMKVGKKTLLRLAAKEAGLPEIQDEIMTGPIACIFSYKDALSGAQITLKFGKSHEHVKLVGGVYDGKMLTKEQAVELAKMPSREVLLATFASMLRSPLVTFAMICNSPLSGFARAVSEVAKKGGTHPAPESAS